MKTTVQVMICTKSNNLFAGRAPYGVKVGDQTSITCKGVDGSMYTISGVVTATY